MFWDLGSDWTNVIVDEDGRIPERFAPEQDYPKPFNSNTIIRYQLSMTRRAAYVAGVALAVRAVEAAMAALTAISQRHGSRKAQLRGSIKSPLPAAPMKAL